MVFSDKKIKAESINIRFYKYSDPNMGWGDDGTIMYASFPKEAFKETEEKRFDNTSFYTYAFTDEEYKKLQKVFGRYWHMDLGYELMDNNKRLKEIEEAKKIIKIVEEIKNF